MNDRLTSDTSHYPSRHGGVHVTAPDELGLGDGSGVMSAFWFTPADAQEFHRGAFARLIDGCCCGGVMLRACGLECNSRCPS